LIKASKKGELSMRKLYWLLTIISRHDTQEYETFFLSHGVENLISIPSSGTAHEHTLDMLGIERTEKTILLAAMNADMLKSIIRGLTVEMKIDLPDRGVAIAIPFSGIGGQRTLEYLSGDAALGESDKEEEVMQSNYELILAIYEKGYTNVVMDAAREAGATGGTTVKAKGTAREAEKFFGLSIAEEKEMLFIVSTAEKKKDIMKAIMAKAGADTRAHAITFSLPVSDTAGFRFADTVDKE
jgi:hypothetical protein